MKETYVRGLFLLLATVISACGPTDTTNLNSEMHASPTQSSEVVVQADMLQTIENIGMELDLRQSANALTAEWAEIWSNAQIIRQQSQINALITRIQRASPGDELTVGSDVLELYFQCYEPVFLLMERQHANGTLDTKLTELRASVHGGQASAQRTFCCRVTSWSDDITCREYDTFGAWAWRKCMGLIPGTAKSRQLFRDSCSNVSGC